MKLYTAIVTEEEGRAALALPPYRVLCSYWCFRKNIDLVKGYIASDYELFLDSGAYSAANTGAPIDMEDYIAYINESGAMLYAGLDVIGDPITTMRNIKTMEERGLHPIPTFHMGGDPKDLRALFDYPYIALGGMVFSTGRERYCDEIWNILLKEAPGIHVHGFGMANIALMERYPWFSVDTSSWKDGRRFGKPKMLWHDMKMMQVKKWDFEKYIIAMGYKLEGLEPKEIRYIWDFLGAQSYKQYAGYLDALNKIKSFDYLKQQTKMF